MIKILFICHGNVDFGTLRNPCNKTKLYTQKMNLRHTYAKKLFREKKRQILRRMGPAKSRTRPKNDRSCFEFWWQIPSFMVTHPDDFRRSDVHKYRLKPTKYAYEGFPCFLLFYPSMNTICVGLKNRGTETVFARPALTTRRPS